MTMSSESTVQASPHQTRSPCTNSNARTPETAIPPQLLELLERTPGLRHQGVVQRRRDAYGRETYRLRYREAGTDGHIHHRSLDLAYGDAVITAVGDWLTRVQQEHRTNRTQEAQKQVTADAEAKRGKDLVTECRRQCQQYGQSRRQRQSINQEFNAIADDLKAVYWLYLRMRARGPLSPRRPGRPVARQLW